MMGSQIGFGHKVDRRLCNVLMQSSDSKALVRVKNRQHMRLIENRFDILSSYPFIKSVGVSVNSDNVKILENMPEVEFVHANSEVSALDTSTTGEHNIENSVETNVFANGLTGKGVRLCVMDTGISPHTDLSIPKDRIVEFVDFVNEKSAPYDDNGHGTFVSGVAVGNGVLSGKKIMGVAPNSELVGVKVISKTGESGTFTILDGMQWLFDNHKKLNIDVVCMSFGADPLDYADPLKMAVDMLTASGLIVVCASGNSGTGNLKSPAISPTVISVGAVDEKNRVAKFSSKGIYHGYARPDLYAIGTNVVGISANGTYATMSGTSVSAPVIAGVCCLLKEKNRNLTPYNAKQMLLRHAKVVDGSKILDLDDYR